MISHIPTNAYSLVVVIYLHLDTIDSSMSELRANEYSMFFLIDLHFDITDYFYHVVIA